jgi:cytochrome c-type biogenesis protein CcsB
MILLVRLAFFAYFLATAGFMVYVFRQNKKAARVANGFIVCGFGLQAVSLIGRWVLLGQLPILNLPEALLFFGWTLAGSYLVLNYKFRLPIMGTFASPMVLALVAAGSCISGGLLRIEPVFQSLWLTFHLGTVFTGYAFWGLAFVAGVMYLIQERQIKSKQTGPIFRRMPSLQVLDNLNYFCLTLGFPMMTLGIITGSAYAQQVFGTYWRWDPKEVWSLILWLFYAALIHQRLTVGWRGRRAAVMSIVGFSVLCFTFVGVSLILPGYHSFEGLERLQGQ